MQRRACTSEEPCEVRQADAMRVVASTVAALLASATISVAFFHQPRPSPRFRVPPPQMGPPPPPQQQQHLHRQNFPPFNNPGQGFPSEMLPPPPPPQHHTEPGPQNRVSGRSRIHPQQESKIHLVKKFVNYTSLAPLTHSWPDFRGTSQPRRRASSPGRITH